MRRIYYLIIVFLAFSSCSDEEDLSEFTSLAGSTDVVIGTALSFNKLSDPEYLAITTEQFSGITVENEMKLFWTWPDGPGSPRSYEQADVIAEYARLNGKALHGHVLGWYAYDDIPWMRSFSGTPAEFEETYRDYVTETVQRYPEARSWDVINEAVTDPLNNIAYGLDWSDLLEVLTGNYDFVERDYNLPRFVGPDYMVKMFQWTREANPYADLYYNDYNLLFFPKKLDKVLELCDRARANGAPIDGIGFQGHIAFPSEVRYGDAYRAFKKVADKGYKVMISELSISINGPFGFCTQPPDFGSRWTAKDLPPLEKWPSPDEAAHRQYDLFCGDLLEEMGRIQAQRYYDYIRAYFDAVPPHLRGHITVWGFSDCCHWYTNGAPWLFGSKDWPCIYDSNLEPKPGYYSMLRALQEG